jgi:hypothetical protein
MVDNPARQRRLASLAAREVPPTQGADATRTRVAGECHPRNQAIWCAPSVLRWSSAGERRTKSQLAKAGLIFGGLLGAIFVATIGGAAYHAPSRTGGIRKPRAKNASASWSRAQDYAIMLDPGQGHQLECRRTTHQGLHHG